MKMKRGFLILILLICVLHNGTWEIRGEVRYHSAEDMAKVMGIVSSVSGHEKYGDRIVAAAKTFEGVPYGKAADNDSVGTIMVRLDSLTQREFIYLSMAIAMTAELTAPSLRDFESNLEKISRRKGIDRGFPSQFFYASDWIVDNVYRDNLKDMTEYLDGGSYRTKTLDYVSHHPEQFPALSNPEVLDEVKVVEFGYRGHRIPHLKRQSIGNKNVKELLQNGDILILSPPETDFDIFDIGFVTIENGEPTFIHIDQESGKVRTDPYPLTRTFKVLGQYFYGYRWLRPVE